MTVGIVIAIIVLILLIWLISANVRVVPQGQAYVIESLGRFKAVWDAGLHLKIPFLEKIVKKVSLKEQVLDFPPQPVITKDNVTINIDSVVFARVFDSRLYTYGVESPIAGLQNLSATTLRNIIGEMELDQTLTSRDQINARLAAVLDEATDPWGIKVTRVELKNIQPPKEKEVISSDNNNIPSSIINQSANNTEINNKENSIISNIKKDRSINARNIQSRSC